MTPPTLVQLRRQSASDAHARTQHESLPVMLTGTPAECRAFAEPHGYVWLEHFGLPFGGYWFENSGGPGRVLLLTPACETPGSA